MRMIARARDESGVTAVFVLIVLVVLLAVMALSIDGGLLYSKFRQVRRANDSAALAAAIECVTNSAGGTTAANLKANQFAADNGAVGTPYQPNVYLNGACAPTGGKVTVYYGASQQLMFGPAVGISSPKQVARSATAVWGPAGGTDGIAPLMLSANRLSTPCQIPTNVQVDQACGFWFNNGNNSNQSNNDLMNAEWGWMDLSHWNVGSTGACSGNSSSSDISNWLTNGYPGDLTLNATPPTYVCRGNGNMTSLFNPNGAVTASKGQMFAFPVNDPSRQVDASGNVCAPNGGTNCTVAKYAIVGFAFLQLKDVYRGNTPEAQQYCGHPSDANARCMVAVWKGYQTGGVIQNGGQNFGLIAVGLAG